MSTAAPGAVGQMEGFRHIARLTDIVFHTNLQGVTQAESLVQPRPAGNCLNWAVGHLVCIYNNALPLFGQANVVDPATLARYDRGSAPITDAAEAMDIGELISIWDQAHPRVDAGLAAMTPEALEQPAPFSPSDDPDETVGSLVATILFHQSYHVGQTGILRRVSGHEGAIK
jgi:hypothetical protein